VATAATVVVAAFLTGPIAATPTAAIEVTAALLAGLLALALSARTLTDSTRVGTELATRAVQVVAALAAEAGAVTTELA
jgi:hypothetical protein